MKLLNYYKQLKLELLGYLSHNKTLLEIYHYNRDLIQVKKLFSENIDYYKQLKNANSFISNYKEKEKVYKPTMRIIDEVEYDNTEESRKIRDFVDTNFNNYLSKLDR